MSNDLSYVIKTLTREANLAHRQWNDPQSSGRGSVYYSGVESGLRKALKMLKRKAKNGGKRNGKA